MTPEEKREWTEEHLPVKKAVLRLYSLETSANGGDLVEVEGSDTEVVVLSSIGNVKKNSWVEVDVTELLLHEGMSMTVTIAHPLDKWRSDESLWLARHSSKDNQEYPPPELRVSIGEKKDVDEEGEKKRKEEWERKRHPTCGVCLHFKRAHLCGRKNVKQLPGVITTEGGESIIDINSACVEACRLLPGMHPRVADWISCKISHGTTHKSVSDLYNSPYFAEVKDVIKKYEKQLIAKQPKQPKQPESQGEEMDDEEAFRAQFLYDGPTDNEMARLDDGEQKSKEILGALHTRALWRSSGIHEAAAAAAAAEMRCCGEGVGNLFS
jgi:hypothetical protein